MTEAAAPVSLRDRLRREGVFLIRFLVVGAGITALDAGLTTLFHAFGLTYVIGRIIAMAIAMNVSFVFNWAWAFKELRGQPIGQQWLGFVIANSAGATLNYFVGWAVSKPGAVFEHSYALAVISGSLAGTVINFTGSRLLGFRN